MKQLYQEGEKRRGGETTIFRLDKIVRDNLPAQTMADGIKLKAELLEGKKLLVQLAKKLQEETYELLQIPEDNKQIGELIDIQEIVDVLRKKLHYSKDQFMREVNYFSERYDGFSIEELMELFTSKIHLLRTHVENLEPQDKEYNTIPELLFGMQKIINALLQKHSISKEAFEQKVAEKREKKGGFDKGIYVEWEKVPVEHWLHEYYSKEPERFPVIDENDIVSTDSHSEI